MADALRDLRDEVRLSQRRLAKLAGVSENTVKRIEGGARGTEPKTIELLAEGLAKDRHGVVDTVRSAQFHDRLMGAAGYGPRLSEPSEPPEPPEDTLKQQIVEAFGDNAHDIEAFLRDASRYDAADKDFILQTVIWLKSLMTAGRAVRERHALFSS